MNTIRLQPEPDIESNDAGTGDRRLKDDRGIAVVLVMIALSMLTAFSAYLFLSSVEEVKISDNGESMIQARFAGRAGIDHARELLRGLDFNAVLKGPDGTYTNTSTYLNAARSFGFRNLADWSTLRSLDITDPAADLSSVNDDGLLSIPGTVLVPKTGIAFTTGGLTARYFLKATDNNGEDSELDADPADNPFIDGDKTIIVRSIGVAKSIAEGSGTDARRNSVAIFEARFAYGNPFSDLGSPAVVIGSQIDATFNGNAFDITGDGSGPGIATIDTNTSDPYHPADILLDRTNGKGTISGNCPPPNDQCIADITGSLNETQQHLSDPAWLYDFVFNQVPKFADNTITNGSVGGVNLGSTANPKVTFVQGDLDATGGITGAGLLVVTGQLDMGGSIVFDGLVLVIGEGSFRAHGMNRGIHGGLIVANLTKVDGIPTFGQSDIFQFDISGNSNIATYDGSLADLGDKLMPLTQLSFREIRSGMDP